MQFRSIEPKDRTVSGVTIPGQSGSNGNEEVLRIPKSSSITGNSSSDYLVSHQDAHWKSAIPLQRYSRCILQPQPTGQECKYEHTMNAITKRRVIK